MGTPYKIRIFVRNKSRYNPETKERGFLFVDVTDFAETTIGDIKENVRRQTHGSLKIDELFLNNVPLATDRSVAHYNLRDKCILESTSNPFWVSCLYIKASEVRQLQEGNPEDENIQKWTNQSLPKKYTLIGILFNTKNDKRGQPPHFPTLDDFLAYLEALNKKGASMHPDYTQKDMRMFEREYKEEFLGRYEDPLAAFIDHHAVRLGYLLPFEIDGVPIRWQHAVAHDQGRGSGVASVPGGSTGARRQGAKNNQVPYCEDCEEAPAEVYCPECQGGLAICRGCSAVLHAGASRRRHQLQGIEMAPVPNSNKPYVPRAFLAPFAILLAMYRALNEGHLSLTELEIKLRAQVLTDTDLQDKQPGKYVGGFDCMDNVLMGKGLVKKEAAQVPTYALTAVGQELGHKLCQFHTAFSSFMDTYQLPQLPSTVRINNRKLCLIIDDNERDKDRLIQYAAKNGVDAQVRQLPAGDYIWILSPPVMTPDAEYTGRDTDNELVLPFVVERKSWEDFENSSHTSRFRRQINNMLGCGLEHCFYLMEGSLTGLRNTTNHQQQRLKALLEQLTTENGFYVNYTPSWMKSARWLLWFTGLISEGLSMGVFQSSCIPYREYLSRVARLRGNANCNEHFHAARRHTCVWRAQHFVDTIIRSSHGQRSLLTTVTEDVVVGKVADKHLLVIQDLEQYNKKRQSTLNKCCEAVHASPDQARGIVEERLGQMAHGMLHYDVMSYWQLYIQVMTGVFVVRKECQQETEKIQRLFLNKADKVVPNAVVPAPTLATATNRKETRPRKRKASGSNTARDSVGDILQDIDSNIHTPQRGLLGKTPEKQHLEDILNSTDYDKQGQAYHLPVGHVINPGKRNRVDHHSNKGEGHDPIKHVKASDIQPFSGKGHYLGSGTGRETVSFVNNGLAAGVRLETMLGVEREFPVATPVVGVSNHHQGMGRDRVPPEFQHLEDVTLDAGDFVDSQNVDYIVSQVLAKSARESGEVSNEDEMYRLALEMSKQDTTAKQTGHTVLTEEEELQVVLERSRQEALKTHSTGVSGRDKNDLLTDKGTGDFGKLGKRCNANDTYYNSGNEKGDIGAGAVYDKLSENEQMRLAIEMSVLQTPEEVHVDTAESTVGAKLGRSKAAVVRQEQAGKRLVSSNLNVLSEEEQLHLAIENSKMDHSPMKKIKLDGKDKYVNEDQMVQIVLDRSKMEHTQRRQMQTSKSKETDVSAFGGSKSGVKDDVIVINSQSSQDSDIELITEVADNSENHNHDFSVEILSSDKSSMDDQEYNTEPAEAVCNIDTEIKDDINNDDNDVDADFIPPSPGVYNSQSFSAKMSSQDCTTSTKLVQKTCDANHSPVEQSAEHICAENTKNLLMEKSTNLHLKSNLFYDSDDETCSESEAEEETVETGTVSDKVGDIPELAMKKEKSDTTDGKYVSNGVCENIHVSSSKRMVCYHGKNLSEKETVRNSDDCIKEEEISLQKGNCKGNKATDSECKGEDNERKIIVETEIKDGQMTENDVSSEDNNVLVDFTDDYDNRIDFYPDSQELVDDKEDSVEDRTVAEELGRRETVTIDSQDKLVVPRPISSYLNCERNCQEKMRQQNGIKYSDNKDRMECSHTVRKLEEPNSDPVFEMDEKLARLMQQEYDRDAVTLQKERSQIDDAFIAQKLQESLDRETGTPRVGNDSDLMPLNDNSDARQNASAEIEMDTGHGVNSGEPLISRPVKSIGVAEHTGVSSVLADICLVGGDTREAALEMQRKELEKIERWKQLMAEDEKLAKHLQQLQERSEESTRAVSTHHEEGRVIMSTPSFKKTVAQHKATKAKALAQLHQYRKLQAERFEQLCSTQRGDKPVAQIADKPKSSKPGSGSHDDVIVLDDWNDLQQEGDSSNLGDVAAVEFLSESEAGVNERRPVLCSTSIQAPKQRGLSTFNIRPSHFQETFHMTQINQSQNSSVVSQSERSSALSHSECSSPSVKNCNITCGNCGGKGHNRTFPKCPKYHTAEESARREAKQEKIKQQREEKKKQEEEMVKLLSQHQQVLEDMTSQIQQEMMSLQERLHQHASELGVQVSSRARKMQGGKKKKR